MRSPLPAAQTAEEPAGGGGRRLPARGIYYSVHTSDATLFNISYIVYSTVVVYTHQPGNLGGVIVLIGARACAVAPTHCAQGEKERSIRRLALRLPSDQRSLR